jgi:hypothetical protein
MSYVPYVPPPEASPRARELGQRLGDVIRDFRQRYPDLNSGDVHMAFKIAMSSSGMDRTPQVRAILALAIGLAAALAGLAVFLLRNAR